MSRKPGHKKTDRRRRKDHRLSRKHVRQLLGALRKAGIGASKLAEALKAAAASIALKKGGHF